MKYETNSDFDAIKDQHPYTTGDWANNEPFPCRVPLFESISAIKRMAEEQQHYIQPIFYCDHLFAAIAVFYRLETVNTTQSVRYAVPPAQSMPNYMTRDRKTVLKLRDRGALTRDEQERWYKLDPISVKLNPWDKYTREVTFPTPNPGDPERKENIEYVDFSLGGYVTDGALINIYQDLGELAIYGIVKTRDGKYAIIGKAFLEEWSPDTLFDKMLGGGPGRVSLGETPFRSANHANKREDINLGSGITATLWTNSYTGAIRIPGTKYPPDYVTVVNVYTNFKVSLSFETRKKSPFF